MIYSEAAMKLLNDVCERIGVDPGNVREVRITPRSIVVEVFELNDKGSKFIRDDGNVALETRTLPFTPVF